MKAVLDMDPTQDPTSAPPTNGNTRRSQQCAAAQKTRRRKKKAARQARRADDPPAARDGPENPMQTHPDTPTSLIIDIFRLLQHWFEEYTMPAVVQSGKCHFNTIPTADVGKAKGSRWRQAALIIGEMVMKFTSFMFKQDYDEETLARFVIQVLQHRYLRKQSAPAMPLTADARKMLDTFKHATKKEQLRLLSMFRAFLGQHASRATLENLSQTTISRRQYWQSRIHSVQHGVGMPRPSTVRHLRLSPGKMRHAMAFLDTLQSSSTVNEFRRNIIDCGLGDGSTATISE